jgi:hypothetical protein
MYVNLILCSNLHESLHVQVMNESIQICNQSWAKFAQVYIGKDTFDCAKYDK